MKIRVPRKKKFSQPNVTRVVRSVCSGSLQLTLLPISVSHSQPLESIASMGSTIHYYWPALWLNFVGRSLRAMSPLAPPFGKTFRGRLEHANSFSRGFPMIKASTCCILLKSGQLGTQFDSYSNRILDLFGATMRLASCPPPKKLCYFVLFSRRLVYVHSASASGARCVMRCAIRNNGGRSSVTSQSHKALLTSTRVSGCPTIFEMWVDALQLML